MSRLLLYPCDTLTLHTTYAVYLNDKSTPVLFKMNIKISIVHFVIQKAEREL